MGSFYGFDGGVTTIAADATVGTGAGNDENIEIGTAGTPVAFKADTDALTFVGGKLDLADGANLTITTSNGNVTVTGVAGVSDETVTIEAASGSISIGAIGDSGHTEIHEVDLDGGGGITLTGNIYTSGLDTGAIEATK